MRICIYKVLLAALSLLALNNCGSGGGPVSTVGAPLVQSATLNSGKAFGYYGDCNQTCFSEYRNHVSFYHTPPWAKDFAQIASGLSAALSAGKSIILSIPDGYAMSADCHTRINGFLTYLDSQALLKNIYAIYPQDEYNLNRRWSEASILAANRCVRDEIANFEGTRGKPIYVIYSCGDPWVALADADIIACDQYEIGDQMLSQYLPALKKYGKPIFLIPGGACPWNYNPYAMVVAANSDDQIVGLEGFIYPDGWDLGNPGRCGIRSSVTLPLYQHVLAPPH